MASEWNNLFSVINNLTYSNNPSSDLYSCVEKNSFLSNYITETVTIWSLLLTWTYWKIFNAQVQFTKNTHTCVDIINWDQVDQVQNIQL